MGLALLLFMFERILPPEQAMDGLAPLRKALLKLLPVDLARYQFDLAKSVRIYGMFDSRVIKWLQCLMSFTAFLDTVQTYKAEVKKAFDRGDRPYVAPEGMRM